MIKDKKNCKHFLNALNIYRINNICVISETAFAIVSELILRVIDEMINNKDYENIRFCLIISETFYKNPKNDFNNSKIFLKSVMEVNNSFRELNFWEELIKCILN